MITRRLKPAGDGDYTKAVQQIRGREQQRKLAAKAALARKQRADRVAITRVATAFQKALNPASSDDPCRYVTAKVKVTSAASATRRRCRRACRRSATATPS